MGAAFCCLYRFSVRNKNRYGFKTELGAPFLDAFDCRLSKDTLILFVIVKRAKELQETGLNLWKHVFVEVKLQPQDNLAGDQLQHTSARPMVLASSGVHWEPAERFQFIVNDAQKSRILVSVFDFSGSEPVPMGDAVIPLRDMTITSGNVTKKLRLLSPSTGKTTGEVEIELEPTTLFYAKTTKMEAVFEYQRWQPGIEWGSGKHSLLRTDPGRWSSIDGKKFGADINEVSTNVSPSTGDSNRSNWTVTKPWFVVSTEYDQDGWQYATDFKSVLWFPSANSTISTVRRRVWQRELTRPFSTSTDTDSSGAKSRGSSFLNSMRLSFN